MARRMRNGLLVVVLVGAVMSAAAFAGAGANAQGTSSAASSRPNILLVLTDDLAWNLVKYMPHVQQMRRQGVTFGRYFVTDSLCCPSRSSIFTGRFPHDTGVFTNGGADGGFNVFHSRGEEASTFAARLQSGGYLTGMMGKYLNGYRPGAKVDGKAAYIPPGWNEWDVAGNGYPEFNYTLNENGTLVRYRNAPSDYLTDVLATKGAAFVDRAAAQHKPFLLEIATFAPHGPYTPAPRDANDFPGLVAPRSPAFDEADISDKPPWLANHPVLTPAQLSNIDTSFRKRAQAVEAVDDLLAKLQSQLARNGQLANTYIVFSSDNGYHMGDHRLTPGKQTAFETDIRVPLIVTGPKVPHGVTRNQLTSNIDLYPTFVRIGKKSVPPSVDGRSLLPLLAKKPPKVWRNAVLVEHHGPNTNPSDPDRPAAGSGNPVTYEAIRTPTSTYVEYVTGDHEYYDLAKDPYELANRASTLSTAEQQRLHSTLVALQSCHSGASCWKAARGK
jgi:N-acetylglucosamine-6-sulfatase